MTEPLRHRKHIQQVDYVRAIASLAVALFHLGGKALPILKYGWLGIYMFFLLSGFIICQAIPIGYSWRMAGRFISKRIIRIEPPYIMSIIVVLLIHFILVVNYQPDWLNVFSHLAYLNNFSGAPYLSPVYWTLGIEFQFYLLVALCFPLIAGQWGDWFIIALCVVTYFVPVPGITLAGFFPVFALGMLYYRYLTLKTMLIKTLLFSIPIIAYCYIRMGVVETGAVLFTLALLALPLKSNLIIRFFSNISFSLYLTHDAIGSTLVVYMGTHLPKTIFYKGIEFTCGILISILFAYLFYLLIELPFLRLSKQIPYSSSTSITAT